MRAGLSRNRLRIDRDRFADTRNTAGSGDLAPNGSRQSRGASHVAIWPRGRAQDGCQREVKRPPITQSTVVSVLGGDCLGDRRAFPIPSLKNAGLSANL